MLTCFTIQPATSLGGVESLIEHRILSDAKADPCLRKLGHDDTKRVRADLCLSVRLSIGLEDLEDLKEDFRRAIAAVLDKKPKSKL